MKTTLSILITLSLVFATAGCNKKEEQAKPAAEAQGHDDHHDHAHHAQKTADAPEEVHDHSTHEHSQDLMKSMDLFLEEYNAISEFLASDNLEGAKKQATSLDKAIHHLKHKPDSEYRKTLSASLHAISHSSDLKSARVAFNDLSVEVIKHVKMMGGLNKTNLFFCPMAFNNKGAHWLQKGEATRNPYYGAQMLGCGSKVK